MNGDRSEKKDEEGKVVEIENESRDRFEDPIR